MTKIIFSITWLAISGGILFLFTQPTYDDAKALEQKIEEYNQALDKASELQQLKQSLLSRYDTFNPADIDRLHKMLPDHVDNVRLVLDIDNLASKNGMAIQNVVISDQSSKEGASGVIGVIGGGKQKHDSLTLKFSTSGTYQNFAILLQELEASLRVVDLVSLGMDRETSSQSGIKSPEPTYRYNITIRTYWLK
ncbi:MAG: hypothetical protein AAB798_00340 [Patescibacteria group bacterium]